MAWHEIIAHSCTIIVQLVVKKFSRTCISFQTLSHKMEKLGSVSCWKDQMCLHFINSSPPKIQSNYYNTQFMHNKFKEKKQKHNNKMFKICLYLKKNALISKKNPLFKKMPHFQKKDPFSKNALWPQAGPTYRPERSKAVKDEVKRLKGPPARSGAPRFLVSIWWEMKPDQLMSW